jgi:hypothetical protein
MWTIDYLAQQLKMKVVAIIYKLDVYTIWNGVPNNK